MGGGGRGTVFGGGWFVVGGFGVDRGNYRCYEVVDRDKGGVGVMGG